MTPRYVSIPATTRLREVVDRHILGSGSGSFMVTQDDQAVGLMAVHNIAGG